MDMCWNGQGKGLNGFVGGFDYFESPSITMLGAKLQGWTCPKQSLIWTHYERCNNWRRNEYGPHNLPTNLQPFDYREAQEEVSIPQELTSDCKWHNLCLKNHIALEIF